jgi:hypothetical protein
MANGPCSLQLFNFFSEPLFVQQLECITFPLAAAVESSNMVGFSLRLAVAKQLS